MLQPKLANALLIILLAIPFPALFCDMYIYNGIWALYNWIVRIVAFLCILYSIRFRIGILNRNNKILFFIFFVYMLYITFYILENKIPLNNMVGVPQSYYSFTLLAITMILLLGSSNYIRKKGDYIIVSKYILIINTFTLLLYVLKGNMVFYLIYDASSDFAALNILSPFNICSYASLSIFSALHLLRHKPSKFISTISITAILFSLIVVMLCNKRGPIIYMTFTILIYAIIHFLSKQTILFLPLVVLIYLFVQHFSENNDIELFSRFANIESDGASGRVGEFSIYSYAIRQIFDHPFFGSHFRILEGPFKGIYPHNFFLEILMTFGIFFSLFLCVLIFRTLYNSIQLIKNNDILIPMIFIFNILLLLSTGTILGMELFWLPLFLIYPNKHLKNISLPNKQQQ